MADLATNQVSTGRDVRVFRFLDLPAETRNEIYSLSVIAEDQVYNLAIFATPAIARVSSQLRSESFPIIFSEAKFFVNVFANLIDQVSRGLDAALPSFHKELHRDGRLYLERSVLELLGIAGSKALFRNFSFRMFPEHNFWFMRPGAHEKKTPPEACISLISISANKNGCKTEVVNWTSHPDPAAEALRAPLRGRRGARAPRRWRTIDIKTTTDRVEFGVQEVAAREGFAGLSLHDLETIAMCFRAA